MVADGKRGDVPHTAAVYAEALFERLGADAATVNPLLGADALEPLIEGAAAAGAGVFTLVRTSNPGAADLLDLETADGPVHEHLAAAGRRERVAAGRLVGPQRDGGRGRRDRAPSPRPDA